ncbi:uncharacterized protein YecT (DUF1311 family) [Pseudorhizobium tarimense]|uniref:Uncharacterized protein YecT (DUF1311 family) n=1 Tax=Pseudorhizobium tarimense TaxID=1079109 RepID=A0ABV2H7D6_9HYPH|nr:lysozyme inhibitor LprI family protein [Pseudorhizobium tarimense]MCJ8519690.1 lysozyme inhibitor LprI family protein [Pseudorhizobium tarimense]
MLKPVLSLLLSGCVLLVEVPVSAQDQPDIDCQNAQTQMEMTYCAERDFAAADEVLNAQYKQARQVMKAWDADAMAEFKGAEDALVAAQRAWVGFRDAQCTSVGFQAHGGTMEPMLIYACQADLTRTRTEELKELTDVMDGI